LNVRRCKDCGKQSNSFKAIRTHQCGKSQCPSCKEYVKAAEHQCFIQPSKKRKRQAEEDERAVRARLDDFEMLEEMEASKANEDEEEKEPLHVFFDIEAMQHHGTHEANLLVYQ